MHDRSGNDGLPFVSIVIPTRNRAADLARTLPTALRLDYPADRLEIVVVDDGSTDATVRVLDRVAREDVRVRAIHQPRGGVNAARNAGLLASRGDPVLFTDDDVDLDPRWARELVLATRRHPHAGCVGGRYFLRFTGAAPPPLCPGGHRHFDAEHDLGDREGPAEAVWGTSMAVRRFAVAAVGPFDAGLSGGGDEVEWQRRLRAAGIPIVYAPRALLAHRRSGDEVRRLRFLSARFHRGRTQALFEARGARLGLRGEALGVVEGLKHAVRCGCWGGLMDAAYACGRLVAAGRSWR